MTQITVTYIDRMGNDLSIVNAARVSFGKKSDWVYEGWQDARSRGLSDRDKKLINYLAKHEHMSPFGHAFLSFHVKAPIFVARQLVKHKFLRWNEISRRYVDDEPEFYVPDVWRGRSADKKQGSDGSVEVTHFMLEDAYQAAYYGYKELVDNDLVAPELARMILPQATMTEWYWSGSLDAFTNMLNLRLKDDTQYETRLVAQQISDVIKEYFPVSHAALVGE